MSKAKEYKTKGLPEAIDFTIISIEDLFRILKLTNHFIQGLPQPAKQALNREDCLLVNYLYDEVAELREKINKAKG